MAQKKSIRFWGDRQVRAVWDEEHSKWWFSAVDIVGAINEEDDYKKCRNYWKYLKGKMVKDGIQLVSVTNHFKFEAPDGKQRAADALDAECVQTLAKHYPRNRANAFLDWFTYSDNTIDGQSKKKARGADSHQEYQQRRIYLCQCAALLHYSSEHRAYARNNLR